MRLYDNCNNLLERRSDKPIFPEAKPITFNTEMVRAILDGRKTQTRRKIKTQPKMQLAYISAGYKAGMWRYPNKNVCDVSGWDEKYRRTVDLSTEDESLYWKPPFHAEDILYVKETWADVKNKDWTHKRYTYLAGDTYFYTDIGYKSVWRPTANMPREVARIYLKVTKVGVKRLQDITAEECLKEGVLDALILAKKGETFVKRIFFKTWNSLIKNQV
ncbi:MAG: hypothetical protein LUG24_08045 [Clostridiales bacterium]|nr:hypothetical protein [Clostridiales bacterium]